MKNTGLKIIRFLVRIICLSAAIFLSLGGPLPVWYQRILPALSPLVALNESLAQRTWYLAAFWLILPILIFAAAFWRGRVFCRWICPAGTVFSSSAFINKKTPLKKLKLKWLSFRIAPFVFYTILFASLIGFTALLPLDPLSSFNRLTSKAATWAAWIPGALVPAFLIIGLFKPLIWCAQICPLGYMFDLSRKLRTVAGNPKRAKNVFRPDRRFILAGLAVGVPAALLLRNYHKIFPKQNKPLILPPGAKDANHFAATCTRCYACVNVCPAKIIHVNPNLNPAQLFMPEVDLSKGQTVCTEDCNKCSQVCPTGAITQLTLKQKQSRQIALGKIRRKDCIAWNDNQTCAVCDEYCPYNAIDISYAPDDVFKDTPLPTINPSRCRGCGYCRYACIAPHPNRAIDITPVEKQKQL